MKSRCELLMRGFLCGIACILPTAEAPVSNFTFELSLYSAPDPPDLVTIPGWQEALIPGESRGSPVMCGIPGVTGIGGKVPGWVAQVDPLIKKKALPNIQLP